MIRQFSGKLRILFSHDDYKEMLVAHAFDTLETAEARALDEHLIACVECRNDLDAWKETAGSLAFVAEPSKPSDEVRARVLENARAHSNAAQHEQERSSDSYANRSSEEVSNVIALPKRASRTFSSSAWFGAIAASLIIALLMISLVVMWQRKRATEAEMARLSNQYSQTQQELARLREERWLFTAASARVSSLAGTEMAKDAHAMLAYDDVTGRAMLVANGLPQAPAGKAYQLWFIPQGKAPMPGGVFSTDAAGHAELRDIVPPEGRSAAVFAVTLERVGGVPSPEGKAYLQSNAS
jgi:anti-sigma-K factor RskA